jgi:hypothetical protein
MRESWLRRLEALEEARKLQDGPLEITCINLIRADGIPVEVTFASDLGGFVCRRGVGEELDAFKSRASDECRAIRWRCVPILVFLKKEASDAALL